MITIPERWDTDFLQVRKLKRKEMTCQKEKASQFMKNCAAETKTEQVGSLAHSEKGSPGLEHRFLLNVKVTAWALLPDRLSDPSPASGDKHCREPGGVCTVGTTPTLNLDHLVP